MKKNKTYVFLSNLKANKSFYPVVFFVISALLIGIVNIYNKGSFSGPDLQPAHYRASLALVTGQSFNKTIKDGKIKHTTITGDDKYFKSGQGGCTDNQLVTDVIDTPLVNDRKNECISNSDRAQSDKPVEVIALLQYPPLGYIPQSLGIGLGLLWNLEPIQAQLLARFANLSVYILIIAFSIAILPKGKWLLVLIGLLPSSIFLASSLSADGLNIAWNILFVSYILKLYLQNTKITKRQKWLIFILGAGLFLLKVAYAPLLLLILALKKNVITKNEKLLLFGGSFAVGALLYIIWSSNWSSLNAVVDVSSQMNLILSNIPKAVVAILLNILYLPVKLLDQPAQFVVLVCLVAGIAIAQIVKVKNILVPFKNLKQFFEDYKLQILSVAAFFGAMGLMFAALLLTWTKINEVGWLNIQGFQVRYIIPTLPLLLVVYYLPTKITKNVKRTKHIKK